MLLQVGSSGNLILMLPNNESFKPSMKTHIYPKHTEEFIIEKIASARFIFLPYYGFTFEGFRGFCEDFRHFNLILLITF